MVWRPTFVSQLGSSWQQIYRNVDKPPLWATMNTHSNLHIGISCVCWNCHHWSGQQISKLIALCHVHFLRQKYDQRNSINWRKRSTVLKIIFALNMLNSQIYIQVIVNLYYLIATVMLGSYVVWSLYYIISQPINSRGRFYANHIWVP